jgi:nucleolar protein 56
MKVAITVNSKEHYFADGRKVDTAPSQIDVALGSTSVTAASRDVLLQPSEVHAIVTQITQNTPKDVYYAAVSSQIRSSVTWDTLVMQATKSIDEADVSINLLSKRLREWFEWHNPEFSRSFSSHEEFAIAVIAGVYPQTTMGADVSEADLSAIFALATQVGSLSTYKDQTREYIDKILRVHAPNFTEVAGSAVGAKLLTSAGSFRRLAMLPASTIQLLGAEKALFRHLKTGSKSPKYGLIYQHNFVQRSRKKGTTARSLANILTVCIRKDYFTQNPILETQFVEGLLTKLR